MIAARDQAIVLRAANIRYGSKAFQHSAGETIGTDNKVVKLLAGNEGAPPASSTPADLSEITVVGRRVTNRVRAESTIGRVAVDTLNYGRGLEAKYGNYARLAIAGLQAVATGGLAPLLQYAVQQGISAAIGLLPENLLRPLAQGLSKAEDFVGGVGGGILLDVDSTSVNSVDREGVAWGVRVLTGLIVGALAAKAVRAYRASKAARAAESTVANEGIYQFTASSGKTYVGQSGDIAARLEQHIASGKLLEAELPNVTRTEVLGGKTAREVAEQLRINELNGVKGLENVRNPIGPARKHLIPDDPRWFP